MARNELASIIAAVGLPATCGPWSSYETVPSNFIEYHLDGNDDIIADNSVYRRIDRWTMNVYGSTDDAGGMADFYNNCEALETAFDDAGIVASRSMDLFPDESRVYAEYTFALPR